MDFPPFYTVQDQRLGGSLLDLMEQIAARAGYEYQINGYPSRRLYRLIAEGKVDLFIGIKGVKAYDDKVLFSTMPITSIELRGYANKPLENFSGHGKRVITLAGYAYGGLRESILNNPAHSITLIETFSHASALAMLNAGRGDLLLNYSGPMNRYLGATKTRELYYQPINRLELFLIIPKSIPNAPQLLTSLEEAYRLLPPPSDSITEDANK